MTAASLRSLLFVPGDSERKQLKGAASAADALILDLEDSVAAGELPAARARVAAFLRAHPDRSRQQLWVRVNGLTSGKLGDDLAAVLAARPDGIVLPKARSAADAAAVDRELEALEASAGLAPGSTGLIVIATETPQSVLNLGSYAVGGIARLTGLTWGAEDLTAALGASACREADGSLTFPFQLARAACLLAATAAGVAAIDTVFVALGDAEGLLVESCRARRDGFRAKLAIHPDQLVAIHAAFSPQAAEIAWARRVVAAFGEAPQAGVLKLDGRMIDRPHLTAAERLLDQAARSGTDDKARGSA